MVFNLCSTVSQRLFTRCHNPHRGVGEIKAVSGFCSLSSQNRSAFVASDSETPRTAARRRLSLPVSWSLLKFMSVEAVIGFQKLFLWGKRVPRLKTGNHSCPVARNLSRVTLGAWRRRCPACARRHAHRRGFLGQSTLLTEELASPSPQHSAFQG